MVENLFWMGRYAERVENVGRLLRAAAQRLTESDPAHLAAIRVLAHLAQKVRLLERAAKPSVPADKKNPSVNGADWLIAAVGNPSLANGLPANTARLLHCAMQLRERMSNDQWRTIESLARVHEPAPQSLEAALAVLDTAVPACTALAGYAFDDMTRDDAWQFLVIGRQLERAAFVASISHQLMSLPDDDCAAVLDALLEIGNVSITYRARYQRYPELLPVLDLLLLDESNPHSLCFQLAAVCGRLEQLRGRLGLEPPRGLHELLRALRDFDLADLDIPGTSRGGTLSTLLAACERCVSGLSDELTQRFFIHAGARSQTTVAA
jgi:uncharacterized alpha-E superfamily protein